MECDIRDEPNCRGEKGASVPMWERLSEPWKACFEEAWEAYCHGSIPIGAVLADSQDRVIYRGRNRWHETMAPAKQVCGNRLAHAEVNVLLQVETLKSDDLKSMTLYTTTEPCVLCFGAIVMSGVRTVRYAASDPEAGGADLNEAGNRFIRSRNIDIRKADHFLGEIQRVIRTDQVLRAIAGERATRLLNQDRAEYPRAVDLGVRWFETNKLQDMARKRVPVSEIVDEIAAALGK